MRREVLTGYAVGLAVVGCESIGRRDVTPEPPTFVRHAVPPCGR